MYNNYTINYESDAINSYLVIKTKERYEDYQVQMITRNTIGCMLKFHIREHNENYNLYYNISSKQKLVDYLLRKKLSYDEIKSFLLKLIDLVKDCPNYYLNCNQLSLKPDTIYIDPSDMLPNFMFIPVGAFQMDINDQAKELLEYLFDKIDTSDTKAVILMHNLCSLKNTESFNFIAMEELLLMGLIETNLNRNDIVAEELLNEKAINEKAINEKAINEKAINEKAICETFIEERGSKDKKLDYRAILVIVQGLAILLFITVINTELLYSKVTGKIKVDSLVATIIILLIIDLFVCQKIIEHKKMNHKKNIFINNDELIHPKMQDLEPKEIEEIEEIEEIIRNHDGTELLVASNDKVRHLPYLIDEGETRIIINNNPFIIGKLDGQVDLVVENSSVSRIHSKIISEENAYYIIDLNSRNGTFLNGERLVSNKKYELESGSKLIFSNYSVTFRGSV